MKRVSIVAAFLMLLFAIAPTPVPAQQAVTAPPSEQTAVEDLPPRHTPISRAERPTGQLTITVKAGDTYGAIAIAHCGTFNAWPALQIANRWPERRIPVGATAVIACAPTTTPAAAKPATKPASKPMTSGAAWVHPLASGRLGNSCYHTSKRPGHNGIDLREPLGTTIRAAAAGTIVRKAYQDGGAGHYLTVKHAGGIYTQYHHLRAPSPLAVGAHVITGQTLGYVGETGNATGPHLHFEVHQGYNHPINPAPFMRAHSINIGC